MLIIFEEYGKRVLKNWVNAIMECVQGDMERERLFYLGGV